MTWCVGGGVGAGGAGEGGGGVIVAKQRRGVSPDGLQGAITIRINGDAGKRMQPANQIPPDKAGASANCSPEQLCVQNALNLRTAGVGARDQT